MIPVLLVQDLALQKRYLYCEIAAEPELFEALDGLHFHTLCEQNADDLAKTLEAVEEKFGPWLSKIKWLNMGGGHHITRDDYDRKLLIKCIRHIRDTYGVEVYLEPGEAIALNAGYLVTEVMDIVENGLSVLILRRFCCLPYAGCAGNAIQTAIKGQRSFRRKGVYLPPFLLHLSGRRCDRGLFL